MKKKKITELKPGQTALMEMNCLPCGAIFRDHLHQKHQGAY